MSTTVPTASITDTNHGIYAVTGPCSMASPCPGDTCPEHSKTSTAAAGGEAAAAVEPSKVTIVHACCHISMTGARDGELITWNAHLYDWHQPGEWLIECHHRDSQFELRHAWCDSEPVPGWVPRPPDGWDLGVRIEAERRLLEAEAQR